MAKNLYRIMVYIMQLLYTACCIWTKFQKKQKLQINVLCSRLSDHPVIA